MSNYKFKPGDRVRCIKGDIHVKHGATGTVDDYSSSPYVIWDSNDMLTDRGQCEDRMWSVWESEIELIESAPTGLVPASDEPRPLEIESKTVKYFDCAQVVTVTHHMERGWTIRADSGIHAGQLIEAITRFNQ